jgi:hypothetical protein
MNMAPKALSSCKISIPFYTILPIIIRLIVCFNKTEMKQQIYGDIFKPGVNIIKLL